MRRNQEVSASSGATYFKASKSVAIVLGERRLPPPSEALTEVKERRRDRVVNDVEYLDDEELFTVEKFQDLRAE